jgi:hypothetical protein
LALLRVGSGLTRAGIFVTDPALGYPPGASSTPTVHGILHDLFGQLQFISLSVACFVLARREATDSIRHGWIWYSLTTGLLIAASDVAFVLTFKLWDGGPAGLIRMVAVTTAKRLNGPGGFDIHEVFVMPCAHWLANGGKLKQLREFVQRSSGSGSQGLLLIGKRRYSL